MSDLQKGNKPTPGSSDFVSCRPFSEDTASKDTARIRAMINSMIDVQNEAGARYFRVKADGDWLWVEGWIEEPDWTNAPFEPAYTLTKVNT